VPSVTLWNFGFRYHLRSSPKFDQTFALNINNAFDLDYLKATKQLGDGRAITLSSTLGFSSLKFWAECPGQAIARGKPHALRKSGR